MPIFQKINNSRWLAIKFLEGDKTIRKAIEKSTSISTGWKYSERTQLKSLEGLWGDDIESIFAEKRYGFIGGIVKETVKRHMSAEEKQSISDKIDMVVTNRFIGIPIFLFVMWGVFQFTFTLGNPMAHGIEVLFRLDWEDCKKLDF